MKIIPFSKGFVLLFFGLSLKLAAQSTVTGTVTYDKMPLSGVLVSVKGQLSKTISNDAGAYVIAVSRKDSLIFSYVGFKTLTVGVNDRAKIDVAMADDATTLSQVTVNAGYYTVSQRESTGSIAKVTAKDIEKQPVGNVMAALQGRVPGLNVVQETGLPGGGFAVTVRGGSSLRPEGNNPLYVVDGVPYSSDPISSNLVSLAIPGDGNPLAALNPADIESIEVLRDADATAIYGSRGANGVVLITTKRGREGKTAFSVTATHGVGKVTRMMPMMDTQQYLSMRNIALQNDGVPAESWDYDVNGTWDPSRYTNWQEAFLGGSAEVSTWQASASGGSENTHYLISGNFRDESTVFPGNAKYRRGGAHLGLDHKSGDGKFTLAFSGTYTAQRNRLPGQDFTALARTLEPNAPALYDASGNLNWENSTWANPLAQLETVNLSDVRDLIANILIGYKFHKNFSFRTSLGYTDLRSGESRTRPSTVLDPSRNAGPEYSNIYLNSFARRGWTAEPQLNYAATFGRFTLEALFGATLQEQQSARLMQVGLGFSSNALLYDLSAASTVQVRNNDQTLYRYQAAYGRVNLNVDGKYMLNFTGRRDGSSRFGPGRQYANFGAVGAAWIFSNEDALKESSLLSFGKLRASYGTTGNDQIGDYQFLDTYGSSGYQYDGISGLAPLRLYNPNFGWESTTKGEVALEAGLFANRINITAAHYRNESSNQLLGIPISGTTGFSSIQANLAAKVQYTGWECSLRSENLKGNFNWTTNFNITLPKSELKEFPGLEQSSYRNVYAIGQPVTIKKLYHFTGVDPQTGLYTFLDANGDGSVSATDDRVSTKDLGPKYYGGLENQFAYKGVTLSFLLQFVKQLNYNYAATYGFTGLQRNQPVYYLDSWNTPGQTATHQLFTTGYNANAMEATQKYAQSDAAISDASFIRLKNVSLSYDFSKDFVKGLGCRLFVQGQNLFTLTSYKGADPEFTYAGFLPPLRTVSAGLQLNF